MPIYDGSGNLQRPRIPVLGKIRLGEKRTNPQGVEHPAATPYFVLRDAPAGGAFCGNAGSRYQLFDLSVSFWG